MNPSLVITGGRVIDPGNSYDDVADILIENGKIIAIGQDVQHPSDATIIDARGLIVAPGLVDLHCHLRVPGQEHKETLETGLAAAAAGGFTTVCCMPNTVPPIDSPDVLTSIREQAARIGGTRVAVIAAVSKGQLGEELSPFVQLASAGAVAFSDDGKPVWSDQLMRQALRESARVGKPLSLHEENSDLAAGGLMNAGPVATRLGLKGLPGAAEDVMVERDLRLLAEEGGRIHLAHVSTAASVDLLRQAKAKGLAASGEATSHHLTLTDELVARPWNGQPYDTRTKVNPPLRSQEDVDAVIAGLIDGTLECISTDHAPHTLEDKSGSYEKAAFGISLFETALASVLTLVHSGQITLPIILERMTSGPARLFGLKAGSLAVGSPADLTVFDPNKEWTVNSSLFLSKGKNTPLDGKAMRGRVRCTIVGGIVAYQAA